MENLERKILRLLEANEETTLDDVCDDVTANGKCYGKECNDCPLMSAKYLRDVLRAKYAVAAATPYSAVDLPKE